MRGREGGREGRERKDRLKKEESKTEKEKEDDGEDERRRDKLNHVDMTDYSCSNLFFSFLFLLISIVSTVRVWRHRIVHTDRAYIQTVRFSFILLISDLLFLFSSRVCFTGC